MKLTYKLFCTLFCIATLLLTACEENTFVTCVDKTPTLIKVSTSPMSLVGEQVPYTNTRANQPLPPEYENSIYSLAILIFDMQEGVLGKFPIKDGQQKLYKYINLKDENGNGLLNTTLSTDDFPVIPGSKYTVCLIANLTEDQIKAMIDSMLDDGTIFFEEFKNYSIKIPYTTTPAQGDEVSIEPGLVSDIYMFGYYQGEVSSHKVITISLGRLISRLEIAFTFDETKLQPDKSIYILFENMEIKAKLFPTGTSPGIYMKQSPSEITSLQGLKNYTLYMYTAPNSAQTEDQALCMKMWYADKGLTSEQVEQLPYNAKVHLCNDQPDVENRNFELNRNSVYHFNLHLK